ncbi:MAG: hypothetical protein M3O22_00150, partial [Pseudomonadota bacterium]|nr:hypothetical protein [Pseudomonadota bacterium]
PDTAEDTFDRLCNGKTREEAHTLVKGLLLWIGKHRNLLEIANEQMLNTVKDTARELYRKKYKPGQQPPVAAATT